MARKRKESEPPGQPEVDPAKGIELLEAQMQKGSKLLESRPLSSDVYGQWMLVTRNHLEKAFGRNSSNVGSVMLGGSSGSMRWNADERSLENDRAKSLTTQLARLEGSVELLRTELQLQEDGTVFTPSISTPSGHRVFLVHGHDEAALQQVARFLEKLDQKVILLREQANEGRTIIEKFEDYADVGFAVILLTGDDLGGKAGEPAENLQPRARQNVVLELGYFLGRLGRSRVCTLYVEGVEIPSDYSGVLFVKLDTEGGWCLQLAKELKAAGLQVDMNKAL